MKYFISKEWIRQKAMEEEGFEVGAGFSMVDDPANVDLRLLDTSKQMIEEQPEIEPYIFGCLVQLLRRDKGLSIMDLASKARIDPAELVAIEEKLEHEPKPRTVHQLAEFFGLPEKRLLELSNVTVTQDQSLREAAVRFAANAKNVMALNVDEHRALTEFVNALSKQ
jgi:HTH-type transcriptional regulator, competence development regulator